MLELLVALCAFALAGIAIGFGFSLGQAIGGQAGARAPLVALLVAGGLCLILLLAHQPLPWGR